MKVCNKLFMAVICCIFSVSCKSPELQFVEDFISATNNGKLDSIGMMYPASKYFETLAPPTGIISTQIDLSKDTNSNNVAEFGNNQKIVFIKHGDYFQIIDSYNLFLLTDNSEEFLKKSEETESNISTLSDKDKDQKLRQEIYEFKHRYDSFKKSINNIIFMNMGRKNTGMLIGGRRETTQMGHAIVLDSPDESGDGRGIYQYTELFFGSPVHLGAIFTYHISSLGYLSTLDCHFKKNDFYQGDFRLFVCDTYIDYGGVLLSPEYDPTNYKKWVKAMK